ncbi:Glucose-6-phosphate 1-dehydrogenase [Diplonema papillatum]|nr:Glucose-6-phosphate 1-dehydrogenase [Diplonema papillatum]
MAALPASAVLPSLAPTAQPGNNPLSIVIFGASGDLAKTKTCPALLSLYKKNLLPDNARIIGFARSPMRQDKFREQISQYFSKGKPDSPTRDVGGIEKEELLYGTRKSKKTMVKKVEGEKRSCRQRKKEKNRK